MIHDLVKFFSSYGSYHANPVNKLIHLLCIPQILLSALQISNHYSFEIESVILGRINFSMIFIILLSQVYIFVDKISGLVASIFYISSTIIGNYYFYTLKGEELSNHLFWAWFIHIGCWILQFIGHGVFEKRAPALLDNLLQVFVAPDFVILEIMFELGYKKEQYRQCQKQIESNIQQFQKQKKTN